MKEILKEIVSLIIEKNYDKIIQGSIEKRGNPEDIRAEIESYPGKICMPPDDFFNNFDFYEIENSNKIIVDFFLWFDNEKSDLMIQVLMYIDEKDKYSFWDILVP